MTKNAIHGRAGRCGVSKPSESVQFNCFSPPVMLATFIIEIVLALYTLWCYKLDKLGKLSVITLVGLAVFQLCEYHVCGGWGMRAEEWARLGFVAISLLPPIGLHMMTVMSGRPRRHLVLAAYGTMAVCCAYFLLSPNAFSGYACTGNYVIFQLGTWPARLYALYYYGWLATSLGLGGAYLRSRQPGKTVSRRQAVQGLIIGYLVFLVPTALANTFKPETRRGIPSIMCGFAVLFAIILVGYILPRLVSRRRRQA